MCPILVYSYIIQKGNIILPRICYYLLNVYYQQSSLLDITKGNVKGAKMIRTCLHPGRSFLTSGSEFVIGWSCMKKTSEVNKCGWSKCQIWTKNGNLKLSNGKVFHAPISECRFLEMLLLSFNFFTTEHVSLHPF